MRQEWVGKRQSLRTSVQLRAQIRIDSEQPAAECIITDISATGARVTVADTASFPDDFDVFIPARSETKWARVRWRTEQQLGVEFLKGRRSDAASDGPALRRRIEELERRLADSPQIAAAPTDWMDFAERLERRLVALEAATARQALANPQDEERERPPDDDADVSHADQFEAIERRLAELAARLAHSDALIKELAASLAALSPAAERRAPAAPETAAELGGAADARLDSLESRFRELRSSVQGLVLLMAAGARRQRSGETQ